jgi:uncharacterized protein
MGRDDVVPTGAARTGNNRAWWLKTLHEWHWISSGLCLLGMLLFSLTGITLNHASQIEARPVVETLERELPPPLLDRLMEVVAVSSAAPSSSGRAAREAAGLPADVRQWLRSELGIQLRGEETEWSQDEVYVALPRPGGDAWVRIGLQDGVVEYESTDRGWISYLNDLHKGRHSGIAWSWFIDLFAVACLVFSITGLLILKMHAANRPSTWPIVGLGLVVPVLLAILFIH